MSIGITIATVMFCFYLYQYMTERRQAKEEDMNVEKCLDERTTTELVLSTLRKIGCEPEIEDQENHTWVFFTYQGEHFTINCHHDSRYITIFDTWWFCKSIYCDVEEIADIHKVTNLANQYVGCTLLYTVNKEIEQIGVHGKSIILFIPQIPQIDQYLIENLNDFFRAQRFVFTELEKCKVLEIK